MTRTAPLIGKQEETNMIVAADTLFSLRRLASALRRFAGGEAGTAGIEFTFVMTLFLIPAWLGFAEVARLQERTTTLNTTTYMVADMIARFAQPDQDDLDDVMDTAEYVIGNDPQRDDLTMLVMGVIVPKKKAASSSGAQEKPFVAWSMHNKGGDPPCTLSGALPPGVGEPTASDRFIIVVDGTLVHDSPLKFSRLTPDTLTHRAIYAPRETATRKGPNDCTAS